MVTIDRDPTLIHTITIPTQGQHTVTDMVTIVHIIPGVHRAGTPHPITIIAGVTRILGRIEIVVDHPISTGNFQGIGSKTSFLVLSLSLRYNFIDVRTYRQKEVKYHKRLASTAQIN